MSAQSNSGSSTQTQTVTVSEDFLKAVDKALIELAALRQIKKISDEQVVEYEDKIKELQLAFGIQEQQLTMSENATAEGLAAVKTLKAALALAQGVIKDYIAELDRVRKQRDKARSRLFKVGVGALILGALLGVFVSK